MAFHGLAPRYLGPLTCVANYLPGQRALRCARSKRPNVPFVRFSTVGGRAFCVAGPQIWNSLPNHITSAETITTFRNRLKRICLKTPSTVVLAVLLTI